MTNSFVQRMSQKLLDEPFRNNGREKWYERVEEIQADIEVFLDFYTASSAISDSA